jgi:hypothetical protein
MLLLLLLLLLQWDEPSFGYTNGTAAAQSDINLFLCPTRTLNTACKAGENKDNNVSSQQLHPFRASERTSLACFDLMHLPSGSSCMICAFGCLNPGFLI